jgi:hypothetical protein
LFVCLVNEQQCGSTTLEDIPDPRGDVSARSILTWLHEVGRVARAQTFCARTGSRMTIHRLIRGNSVYQDNTDTSSSLMTGCLSSRGRLRLLTKADGMGCQTKGRSSDVEEELTNQEWSECLHSGAPPRAGFRAAAFSCLLVDERGWEFWAFARAYMKPASPHYGRSFPGMLRRAMVFSNDEMEYQPHG